MNGLREGYRKPYSQHASYIISPALNEREEAWGGWRTVWLSVK